MCKDKRHKEIWYFLRKEFSGFFWEDEPLAAHTWYRIGGPADFFVYPRSLESLATLLKKCRSIDMPTYFWGDGSNILANDNGFRGAVISVTRFFNHIERNGNFVEAETGAKLQDLVLFCEQRSLGGLEYLAGIPGTVGGALIMNAGTQKSEIGRRVEQVYLLNKNSDYVSIERDEISFGYRMAPELQGRPIIGCRLTLYHEEEEVLKTRRINQIQQREAKQPFEYPSCGSVFKRPAEHYVGAMVEQLGLKGLRHGDAVISEKHGGFIINLGNAKALDVMFLVKTVQESVYKHFAIELEPEVRFVGF